MADKNQSKIRYDDFVSKVQADPANPQATIMLAGFAGRGPEGHVRIYPDPALVNWYDVPEADVVHSQPIADSALGGSYIWVKSSAQIKPGSAEPAPQAQPQAMAAAAVPPHMQPTPTAVTLCAECGPHTLPPVCTHLCQPTPQTHCFICPPPLTQHCTIPPQCHITLPPQCPITPPALCTPGCPPPPTHLPLCPTGPILCDLRPTFVAVCTQVGCPTQHPVVCTHFNCPTNPVICNLNTQQIICHPVFTPPGACGPHLTTPQLTTPQFTPQMGQAAVQQAQPQALAGPAAAQVAFTQHICPTPSAVQHCGPPPITAPTVCALGCGGPQTNPLLTHCLCPTPPNFCVTHPFTPACTPVCGHPTIPLQTHCLCITPAPICVTHPVTANIECLQTANTPCLTITFAGCTPQSIACTPNLTPVQNGVFTPFGR